MRNEKFIADYGNRAPMRIENDRIVVGGSLYLAGCTGLTALPDGLSVKGSLTLSGCTGLTALPDGLSVSDHLYLDGCTGLIGTKWRSRIIRIVDGYSMLMGRGRKVGDTMLYASHWLRNIAPDKPLTSCYIAEQGDFTAHGDTPAEAMRDLRFKIAQVDFDASELAETIRERGTVRWEDFRLMTGACSSGLREGMIEAGLNPEVEELPLATVMSAAHGEYGAAFKRAIADERNEA